MHRICLLLALSVALVVGRQRQVLPRSSHDVSFYTQPWSPSSQIDEQGFLTQLYQRIPGVWEKDYPVSGKHRRILEMDTTYIRQVPGDGNCLFNAIALSLFKIKRGRHFHYDAYNFQLLRQYAQSLRDKAVNFLEKQINCECPKLLYIQGDVCIDIHELAEQFSTQYGISVQEYCDTMRQDGVWAGGPEIVALSNALKRPIHLYELYAHANDYTVNNGRSRGIDGEDSPTSRIRTRHETGSTITKRKTICLRRMCCFGSPRFDKQEAIHILSADCRFPDVPPGQLLKEGNHFLSVFPAENWLLSSKF